MCCVMLFVICYVMCYVMCYILFYYIIYYFIYYYFVYYKVHTHTATQFICIYISIYMLYIHTHKYIILIDQLVSPKQLNQLIKCECNANCGISQIYIVNNKYIMVISYINLFYYYYCVIFLINNNLLINQLILIYHHHSSFIIIHNLYHHHLQSFIAHTIVTVTEVSKCKSNELTHQNKYNKYNNKYKKLIKMQCNVCNNNFIQKKNKQINITKKQQIMKEENNINGSSTNYKKEFLQESLTTLHRLNKIVEKREVKGNNNQPFPGLEHSKTLSHHYSFTPEHLAGNTWDARHLQNLIKIRADTNNDPSIINSQSKFFTLSSIAKLKRSPTKFEQGKKNINQYGYSNLFPLIQKPTEHKQIIPPTELTPEPKVNTLFTQNYQPENTKIMNPKDRLNQIQSTKRFNQHQQRIRSQKLQHSRKLDLVRHQYPHGILNYENPECESRQFCEPVQPQKTLTTQRKERAEEFYNKHLASIFQAHLLPKMDNPDRRLRKTSSLAPTINNPKQLQTNGLISNVNPAINFYNLNRRDYNIVTNSKEVALATIS